MPKRKYNRPKMKIEYMSSSELSISKWLKENYGIDRQNHGSAEKRTGGRQTEKKERLQKLGDQLLLSKKEEFEENLRKSKNNLFGAVMKLSTLVAKHVSEISDVKDIVVPVKEMKELAHLIKTELGEPTTVNRSELTGMNGDSLFKEIKVTVYENEQEEDED